MLGFTVVVALTVLPQAQDSVTRVIVGPDYLVSRDGDRPHVEIMAAANPRDSKNLIAGAITFTRPDGGVASKVYATLDGGLTWTDFSFAKQMKMGGADPQVAFTRAGTAIFASLAIGPDETGRTRAFLHAYRSEDGGTSWSAPFDLGASYDHPMMIADQTDGRFAGRIYMSVLYGRDYHLGVFRSEDDGRSWIGPVEFISGEGERGLNVDQMLVLSEGTIVAPFIEFPFTPEMRGEWEESDRAVRFHTVTSSDGGVTFSAPKPGVVLYRGEYPERDHRYGLGVMYGVDRSERHRDRIFALWADPMRGRLRTVISLSDDRGASWSAPRDVDPGAPAGAEQFQATVRVNQEGVVGVTWYDTRGTSGEMAFNQYFAASLDGGMSFTEPVRVSTVESKPFSSANLLPSATAWGGPGGELRVGVLSAAGRWLNGGDYIGLTAAADGSFHPVWADARSGSYQVYTARVRVERRGIEQVEEGADAPSPNPIDVTSDIELVSDPGRFNLETMELEWWIRLKNASSRPIHGPIEVEIRNFGDGMGEEGREFAPEVLNAANGETGPGAIFIYDRALGSGGVLPPGGVTGAILWRFRLKDALRTPGLHLFVKGRVR